MQSKIAQKWGLHNCFGVFHSRNYVTIVIGSFVGQICMAILYIREVCAGSTLQVHNGVKNINERLDSWSSPSLLDTPFKPVFKQLWSMNRCSWWSHTNDRSVMVANRHVQYFHIEGLKIGESFGFMLPSPRFYGVPSVGPYGLTVHLVCLDSLIFVVNYMFPHTVYYDNVLHVFGSYH